MHFSLDVWNTLIIPNSEFAEKRNQLIGDKLDVKAEFIKQVYKDTKRYFDERSELYGIGEITTNVYKQFSINVFSILSSEFTFWEIEEKLAGLEEELQKLFLQYPPTLLDEIVRTINKAESNGHAFSIGSNNNFIKGETILKFFEKNNLKFYFSLFSSRRGIAKPDPEFWKIIIYMAGVYGLKYDNMIHIGDNPICDNPGKYMRHAIIESPFQLANTIKEYIGVS